MREVVSSFQIPVKPEILNSIQTLMADDEPDMGILSNLISSDVGLSSAILKIINSPFYGMNRRISEIKQAVMMLGLKTINALVTSILLKESFKGTASISLERFWDDALDIANAMTFVGNKVKNEVPIDMLYSIGLFHDCGIPMLALKFANYRDILVEANRNLVNSVALEEQYYHTNHAVLGYYVSSSWHLPKGICELIAQHHDTQYLQRTSDPQSQLIYAVLKIAENIVEKAKRYKESPDWKLVEDEVLDIIGISPTDYIDLEDDFVNLLND